MRSEARWEIVVISDEEPVFIANVLRDAVHDIAETFGYDGAAFDIAAFDPDGACVGERAHGSEDDQPN